jgi:hypothetical protein
VVVSAIIKYKMLIARAAARQLANLIVNLIMITE